MYDKKKKCEDELNKNISKFKSKSVTVKFTRPEICVGLTASFKMLEKPRIDIRSPEKFLTDEQSITFEKVTNCTIAPSSRLRMIGSTLTLKLGQID